MDKYQVTAVNQNGIITHDTIEGDLTLGPLKNKGPFPATKLEDLNNYGIFIEYQENEWVGFAIAINDDEDPKGALVYYQPKDQELTLNQIIEKFKIYLEQSKVINFIEFLKLIIPNDSK